jgi:hypothetical protein
LAKRILKRIEQFRNDHKDLNLDQKFDSAFGDFRFHYCRDAEWYSEQEPIYKRRVEWVERCLEVSEGESCQQPPMGIVVERWEAMKAKQMLPTTTALAANVVSLAILYHEQRKYVEAKAQYERALSLYRSSAAPPGFLQVVMPWIERQITNCNAGKSLERSPEIRLPKGVEVSISVFI